MDIHSALIETIKHADRPAALALLEAQAKESGYERLLVEVIQPALERIGNEWWDSKAFTLAQAYVAAKVTEDIVMKLAEERTGAPTPAATKGPVVIGNIEEDFHALGRRMVGIFLRADGWDVIDLGNDVPAGEFVNKAVEVGARVIGVSAMMITTARNIKQVREEIDRRHLTGRIRLAVGGAVFGIDPGLLDQVGADGTASNALGAPRVFSELWSRSLVPQEGA